VSRVVVVGAVNADMVVAVERLPAPGETVTGGRFARHGGGKGANQAVAAARLGADVRLVAAVGDDDLGADAVAALAAEGVDVGGVARREGVPTGVALICVDASGENLIAVASGANATLDGDAVRHALARDDRDAPAEVVLLGNEVPEEAVVAACAAGGRVILNPAPARPIPEEVLAAAPLLTPNAAEARALGGAETLAERTGAPVLVTLGPDGVDAVEPGSTRRFPAPAVVAVDTTGAGDAFNGALAAELAAGRPLDDAVRTAIAAAALSTRARGAREGMPTREELARVDG
jgi:ribokinase